MIKQLKGWVHHLLFKGHPARKFVPVQLLPDQIIEKVFFVDEKTETEITSHHCVVCHDPFQVAIWVNAEMKVAKTPRLIIRLDKKIVARVELKLETEVDVQAGRVLVFKAIHSSCHQLPYWRQYILLKRYFLRGKKDTFHQGMSYAAMYSYPRIVSVVSFREEGYVNIFPMDFLCLMNSEKMVIMGLRKTNTTLARMIAAGKVVIGDTTNVSLDVIYDLGRNHSSNSISVEQLPFKVSESERFRFYVPAFCNSYREIEIIKSIELGTHTMMIGKQVNEIGKGVGKKWYHVHFFGMHG